MIDREVRAVTDAVYLRELPRLLRLMAARTSGELNNSDVARDLGLSRSTTESYLAHLEAISPVGVHPPPMMRVRCSREQPRRPDASTSLRTRRTPDGRQ